MITSVNLSAVPYIGNTDSTRLQMSAKQITQALTSLNTNIPYTINGDYNYLADNSIAGIAFAKHNGEIVFNNNDIMIVKYDNNTIETHEIPPIKKTYSVFGSYLRNSMKQGSKVFKNEILFEYDCFTNGIPSHGYNVFTGYMPFFGLMIGPN